MSAMDYSVEVKLTGATTREVARLLRFLERRMPSAARVTFAKTGPTTRQRDTQADCEVKVNEILAAHGGRIASTELERLLTDAGFSKHNRENSKAAMMRDGRIECLKDSVARRTFVLLANATPQARQLEPSKKDRAAEIILALIDEKGGTVPVSDIDKAVKAAGIGENNCTLAKEQIIKSGRVRREQRDRRWFLVLNEPVLTGAVGPEVA